MNGFNNVKRTLYAERGVLIESFMYDPVIELTSDFNNKKSYLVTLNPIVMIRSTQKKNGLPNVLNNNYFKMNQRNHYKVLKFFNKILQWFFDENKNDLFYEYEGELNFNADYKNLKEKLKVGTKDIQRMEAIPAVIDFMNRKQEGVILYINETENQLTLTLSQLQDIYGIIRGFNFQQEMILLYEIFKDIRAGNYIKREDIWGGNLNNINLNQTKPIIKPIENEVKWK